MSDLFMDMHRRRHSRQPDTGSNSSFNTSACSDYRSSAVNEEDANEAEDEISNILSLKLKKPQHWNWELSTSRSCKNIALPRILLYDHNGQLLVDANTQAEQVYKAAEDVPPRTKQRNFAGRKRSNRAATANLAHSIRQALNQEFDGLQIQEATPSLQSPATSSLHTRQSSPLDSSSCIDFYTNDLPDYKFERRSSSLKGVRFKDDDTKSSANSFQINGLPTPPPSSGTTPTTGTSSSSGPREKRRYRRSHSSGRVPVHSPSILERFSFNRGRFSSPETEHAEQHEVHHAPRYFLRTSKAGTLVVQEESFSRCRRRPPRPKHSSSENLQHENSPRSHSTSSLKMQPHAKDFEQFLGVQQRGSASLQAGSLQNVAELRHKKRTTLPIRRFRSDGNVLLQAAFSSSDEEEPAAPEPAIHRPRHRYDNLKRHLKGELVTIDPDNGVFHPYGSPTER